MWDATEATCFVAVPTPSDYPATVAPCVSERVLYTPHSRCERLNFARGIVSFH
jgi:hypothetical protein